jgi:hypothetical protein
MPGTRRDITHEALVGKAAPAAQVLKGMSQAEAEQQQRFATAKQSQDEATKLMQPFREGFGERVGGDQLVETVRGFGQLEKGRALRRPLAPPAVAKEQGRIFHGSVGLTRVPPYNYQWTWFAKDNNAATSNLAATAANGNQSFVLNNNLNSAHVWGATAVGIYYRPIVATGIAHLFANPSFTYNWYTYSVLDSSHSDGWIGLYVGRYNLSGDLDAVPVSQQISLWNNNSWWSGAGSHTGSNSGFPLSAWFVVDSSHWYAMWVWTGGSVFGDGWGTFSGSGAQSSLSVATPSISLVVY